MATKTDKTIAVILSGPASAALEDRLLVSALQRVSASTDSVRWLSQSGALHAIEAETTLHDAQQMAELQIALDQIRAGGEIDCAALPARNRKKRLLVCDMDSTIIEQECLDELADFAGLKAKISEITERAMRGELDFEDALQARVAMLKGLDLSALEQCYKERITLMPGARELVATMRANGAACILVSGGFTYFTSRIAKAVGFHTHRGNLLLDDGHALTGEVGKPILGREAKLVALQEEAAQAGCMLEETLAIGDGANDLAMIEAAGLGIAYRAKPIVAEQAGAAISHTDLRTALYYQGYSSDEFAL